MTKLRSDMPGIDRLKEMMAGPGAAPLGVLLGFRCIEVGGLPRSHSREWKEER